MSYPKIAKLVETLAQKTEDNQLNWEATEASDTFQITFPAYTVRLYEKERSQNSDNFDYFINILNDEGELIEKVSDVDINPWYTNSYDAMRNMYSMARRQVLGVETALDDILGELNKDDPF